MLLLLLLRRPGMLRMLRMLSMVAVVATPAAHAAECADWFRITLADGTRTCLTEHPLAEESVVGQFGSVRRNVPTNGYYSLAATPALPRCERAVGMGALRGTITATGLVTETPQRNDKALRDCRLRTRNASAECACRLVIVEGRSPLTAPQFLAYSGTAVVAGAQAASAVAGTRAAPPGGAQPANTNTAGAAAAGQAAARPASPPANRPVAAEPPRANEATGAEIAALRQQVDSLRSEISRTRPPAADAPRKVQRARALIVGNGRYANLGTLANPTRDAQAIAAKLRSYGIEVDLHLNLDRSTLVRALAEFQSRAADYDVNLFFYAGHGLQVGGINYIVPVDMTGGDAVTVGNVKLNTISLDDALEYLPAATRVVFLDACRDNPIARVLRGTRSNAGLGLAPVSTVGSGTLLSYATRDGSTADDGRGNNSPYTTALLQHLDAPEDIALVLRRVRQAVLQATGKRQEPWEYGSLVGDTLVVSRLGRK